MNSKTDIEENMKYIELDMNILINNIINLPEITAIAIQRQKQPLLFKIKSILTDAFRLQAKANKYDSLVEKIEKKIEDLDKIAKKKDVIPETVKEEKINGDIVYSKRFKADGYIAKPIIKMIQELLEEE